MGEKRSSNRYLPARLPILRARGWKRLVRDPHAFMLDSPDKPYMASDNHPSSDCRERTLTGSLFLIFGGLFGLAIFTFSYAEGTSYLSDDPAACVNCHIMRDQFEGRQHASHRQVATCNDCHTPHAPVSKWAVKAIHGWNHSVAFTTGRFEEPIRMKKMSANVVQQNCVDCHAGFVGTLHSSKEAALPDCASCHDEVGH